MIRSILFIGETMSRRKKKALRLNGGGQQGEGDGLVENEEIVTRNETRNTLEYADKDVDDESVEFASIGGSSSVESFHTDAFEDQDDSLLARASHHFFKEEDTDEDDEEEEHENGYYNQDTVPRHRRRKSSYHNRRRSVERQKMEEERRKEEQRKYVAKLLLTIDDDSADEEEPEKDEQEQSAQQRQSEVVEDGNGEEEIVGIDGDDYVYKKEEQEFLNRYGGVSEQALETQEEFESEEEESELRESRKISEEAQLFKERIIHASADPVFQEAGTMPGLEIWRTTGNSLQKLPRRSRGKFGQRDCYLALMTHEEGDSLLHNLHYWCGQDISEHDHTEVLEKAFGLDYALNGRAIVHKEIQGFESDLFRGYFTKTGIIYLTSLLRTHGRTSALDNMKKLFLIKSTSGKKRSKTPLIFEKIPNISSMNNRDVFVLDLGKRVYIWNGPNSSPVERFAGCLTANNIVSSRHGKARKYNVDDMFWTALNGHESEITDNEDEEVAVRASEAVNYETMELYKFKENGTGKASFSLQGKGDVRFQDLNPYFVFLVNSNVGAWVWHGAKSEVEDTPAVMKATEELLAAQPESAKPVSFIKEKQARESSIFQSLFPQKSGF